MKILVLNNDLMERSVIQQVLQRNGHEIVIAENVKDALAHLRDKAIRFLIVDRAGTDIDETGFIKTVRESITSHYVYILLITPSVQDTDIASPRTGPDDYLRKPIAPVELKSRMHLGERILRLGDHLVKAKGALETASLLDVLTSVMNEQAFLTYAFGELERARRTQAPLSLIALEVDNFAAITARYGENIGNDVLTVVAQGIREKSRPYDGLGRHENSFLFILPGVIGQDAEKVADRILKGIIHTKITLLDGTELKINLSAGIASSAHVTVNTESEVLIDQAKQAANTARDVEEKIHTVFI